MAPHAVRVAELDVTEVVDEPLQQLTERATVVGRPSLEHVAEVPVEHVGDPPTRLVVPAGVISTTTTRASASPATRSTNPSSSSLRTCRPVDAASMPVARASSPRERRAVLVDPAQQRVRGPRQIDTGRGDQAGVPVPAGPQPIELLERPLGPRQIVHRADPTLLV